MREFNIWWSLNDNNYLMIMPYYQSINCLGLIKGEEMEDWVHNKMMDLHTKVTRTVNALDCTDEALWDKFKGDIESHFCYAPP